MKKLALLTVFLALNAGHAVAQSPAPAPVAPDPTGDWRVEEGTAHIRVAICDGNLWGVIGWEQSPGTDAENPDPALRSRPTLGMPILVNMKPDAKKPEANRWVGKIYNAKNGKMYDSNVTLISPTALKVQGCVLGVFCGGETWTKVAAAPAPIPAPAPSTKGSSRKGAAGAGGANPSTTTGSAPSALSASVCSGLSSVPRPAH
jgi:uncharacterized protein (DUF2147 family)